MILELDDEEYSDLRAAVLFQFKGVLRDLARTAQRTGSSQLQERCDRLEHLVSKLGTIVPAPNDAPH